MVSKVFRLLLLFSPIAVAANINMDMFDLIFFRTGIIVLFCVSLLDTPKRELPEYLKKCVFSLLGLCVLNLFVHSFAPIVLATTMNIFLAVVGFCIVYRYWDNKQDISKPIMLAGLINILFFFSQTIGFDPIFDELPAGDKFGAFLGNSARLGIYLALIVPFVPVFITVLILVVSAISHQFTPLIAIALLLLFKIKNRGYRILLLGAYIIVALYAHRYILWALNARIHEAWFPTLQRLFDSPLIGAGIGAYSAPNIGGSFNSYLQFIVGAGLLGLVWFGYVFNKFWHNLKNNIYTLPLIVLACVMLVEYPLELTRLWYLIIAIILIGTIKKEIV